jgi:hypothetical protein
MGRQSQLSEAVTTGRYCIHSRPPQFFGVQLRAVKLVTCSTHFLENYHNKYNKYIIYMYIGYTGKT